MIHFIVNLNCFNYINENRHGNVLAMLKQQIVSSIYVQYKSEMSRKLNNGYIFFADCCTTTFQELGNKVILDGSVLTDIKSMTWNGQGIGRAQGAPYFEKNVRD